MVAADDRNVITWSLTPGQAGDAPEAMSPQEAGVVVPPSPTRREPWPLDKARYRRRNEVERLFHRLKAWHQVFTRYDKTDVMFAAVG